MQKKRAHCDLVFISFKPRTPLASVTPHLELFSRFKTFYAV
jgi:hypothetical protein